MGIFKNLFNSDLRLWNSEFSDYLRICVTRANESESNEAKKVGNAIIAFTHTYTTHLVSPKEENPIFKIKIAALPEGTIGRVSRSVAAYAVGVISLKGVGSDRDYRNKVTRFFADMMDLQSRDIGLAHDIISAEDPSLHDAPRKMYGVICENINYHKPDVGARMRFELTLQSSTIFLLKNALGKPE
jgi:hypothetical protein